MKIPLPQQSRCGAGVGGTAWPRLGAGVAIDHHLTHPKPLLHHSRCFPKISRAAWEMLPQGSPQNKSLALQLKVPLTL